MAKGILRIKVLGDAAALDGTLSGVHGSLGKFGTAVKAAGLAVGAAFVGAGVAVGKFAFSSSKDLEQATNTIRKGTGATGDALADLGDSMRTVFKAVPGAAQDAGTAIADLNTRTGATGKELEALAKTSLQLSRITGEDLAGQIAATTRVFGDWGVAAQDQVGVLNDLFKVSQSTGIGVTTLSEKVVQFGAPLRQLGFSLAESTALMGKFEKEGVNLETVLAGMKIGLANFAKAGEAPADALKRATDAIKNAGSQAEANKLAIEIFGQRAGPDMAAAIREGRFELDELLATLEASPETINAAAEATYTFSEKWGMVKNKLAVALEPLGKLMLGALEKLAEWIDKHMPAIEAFFSGLADKVRDSGLSLGELAGVFKLLSPGIALFRDLWPQLQPLIQTVIAAISQLSAAVLPALQSAWQTLITAVAPIVEQLVAIIVEAIPLIIDTIMPIIEQVLPLLAEAFSVMVAIAAPILQELLALVQAVFPVILETIKTVMDAILPIVQGVLGLIKKFWDEHGEAIMNIVRTVFDTIQQVITAVMGIIQGIINVVMGVITGDWSRAWEGIQQIFGGVWDAIRAIVTGAINAVKAVIEAVLGIIASIWSAVWGGIKAAGEAIWGSIRAGASAAFTALKSLLSGIWDSIKAAWQAMWTACSQAWDTAAAWIRDIPNKLKAIFVNAKNWLLDAGKAIIQGLWDGMKAIWEKATGWIGKIGGAIKGLKGPIEKDRTLLEPEGRAIIEGLAAGMRRAMPAVEGLLKDLSADITVQPTTEPEEGWGSAEVGNWKRGPIINITIESITINGGRAEAEEALGVFTGGLTTRLQALGVA